MVKWPRFGSCKTRLSKDIGKKNALNIQRKMLSHTLSVSKNLQDRKIAEVSLAITGVGFNRSERWCKDLGIKNFCFQGKGCLGEKMKKQIYKSRRNLRCHQKRNIIFIGTDLPNLCSLDIVQTISKLENKDVVIGPSNDGGYWLIGLSNKLLNPLCAWPFSGISWGSDKVLKETIRLASLNQIDYQLLQTKNDLDNIMDLSPWLDHKKFRLSASSYQL